MSILLHACCGPCSMYPQSSLITKGEQYDLFWFNPNIHPLFENNRRLENLKLAASHFGKDLIQLDSFMEDYWLNNLSPANRCDYCYQVRMEETAKYASLHGYDCFSTTLLVSPYQNHERIVEVANKMAKQYNVDFYYEDYRPGFREGQTLAREIGLYRQKYCGCIYSLNESDFKDKIIRSFQ